MTAEPVRREAALATLFGAEAVDHVLATAFGVLGQHPAHLGFERLRATSVRPAAFLQLDDLLLTARGELVTHLRTRLHLTREHQHLGADGIGELHRLLRDLRGVAFGHGLHPMLDVPVGRAATAHLVHRVVLALDGPPFGAVLAHREQIGARPIRDHDDVRHDGRGEPQEREQVRLWCDAGDLAGRRLHEFLVEYDLVPLRDQGPARLALRRRGGGHSRVENGECPLLGALVGQLPADRPPAQLELRGGVLGVVRVVEVDRRERSFADGDVPER